MVRTYHPNFNLRYPLKTELFRSYLVDESLPKYISVSFNTVVQNYYHPIHDRRRLFKNLQFFLELYYLCQPPLSTLLIYINYLLFNKLIIEAQETGLFKE